MRSSIESPRREADSPPTPTPPRRWKSGSIFKLLAGALAGAFLMLAGVIFYLQFNPLSNGGTVVSAPAIQSSGQGAIDAAAIYKADAPGIVLVKSEVSRQAAGSFGPERQQGTALGSGFMIDGQGRILTNDHVVSGASKTTVTLLDKKTYEAKLVGTDPSNDLAVLKIDAPADELKPLPLGDSSQLEVGQPVIAIGNPLGLSSTETQGIISALERDIQAPNGFTIPGAIQTDTPLTNGNSGGPLIDTNGSVIGINSQGAANQDGTTQAGGIGFAIPINIAKDAVGQLDQSGEITRPYLGISGYGITPDMENLFPTDKGVAVAKVASGGPAERAGIMGGDQAVDVGGDRIVTGGDVIVAVDGSPVSDMSELQKPISGASVGQKVTLTILRGSQTKDVQVTLDNRPQSPAG
jgi:S1-C subfamily serine protease